MRPGVLRGRAVGEVVVYILPAECLEPRLCEVVLLPVRLGGPAGPAGRPLLI